MLAAEGRINFPLFLFANVGNDSENPATLDYLTQIAEPYAYRKGIELVEVQKVRRNGEPDTIRAWLDRTEKSIGIPMRMANGAPGNRDCTQTFKIKVIDRELKRRGATADAPATIGMGISVDERLRMRTDSGAPFKRLSYPLIDLGLSRADCMNVISRAGLPIPPKSSCYFCPFKRTGDWQKMCRDEPHLFALSVALEDQMNERRAALGRDAVYLSSKAIPLREVVGSHDQMDLFEGASRDIAGYCHA